MDRAFFKKRKGTLRCFLSRRIPTFFYNYKKLTVFGKKVLIICGDEYIL